MPSTATVNTSLPRVLGVGAGVTAYLGGMGAVGVGQGGRFGLRGGFGEEANFSAGPFSGAVVHSGGFLYWSLGSGGSFTPFLRIDGAGNVDLNGTLREESALAFLIDGQGLRADAQQFGLAHQVAEGDWEFPGAGAGGQPWGTTSKSHCKNSR